MQNDFDQSKNNLILKDVKVFKKRHNSILAKRQALMENQKLNVPFEDRFTKNMKNYAHSPA